MQEKITEVNWSQLFGFFVNKEQELKSKGITLNAMGGGGGCSSDNFCSICSDCGECGSGCGD